MCLNLEVWIGSKPKNKPNTCGFTRHWKRRPQMHRFIKMNVLSQSPYKHVNGKITTQNGFWTAKTHILWSVTQQQNNGAPCFDIALFFVWQSHSGGVETSDCDLSVMERERWVAGNENRRTLFEYLSKKMHLMNSRKACDRQPEICFVYSPLFINRSTQVFRLCMATYL